MALAFHARPAQAQSYNYGYPAPPGQAPQAGRPAAIQFSQDSYPSVVQVAQNKGKEGDQALAKQEDQTLEFRYLREIPGIEVLSRVESQAALYERMRQEALRRNAPRIIFPDEPVLSKVPYQGRTWPDMAKLVEPDYVMHTRLLFEQQNFERGLWDLGILTPVLEAGKFYFDVAALPYHLATRPCQQYDSSAGKCLPGDPTPFFLYPVEFSLTGAAAEAAVITGGFFIFP